MLVAFVLFPLVVRGAWREKLTWAAAFLAAAVLPLAAWSVHNGIRFGDYTLARGGNAVIPFYRAFIVDRIVSPENGPASRKLAKAVDERLLTREPYRSYGVTRDEVFTSGSFRIHEDLYLLSDQVFGWDIELLRPARRGHRGRQGAPRRVRERRPRHDLAAAERAVLPGRLGAGLLCRGRRRSAGDDRRRRPAPAEAHGGPADPGRPGRLDIEAGQRHPAGVAVPHRFRFEFADPADKPRLEQLERRVRRAHVEPPRPGRERRARQPAEPALALVPAAGALDPARARRHRRPATAGTRTLVALSLAALLVVALNALGQPADAHFALPVLPAFVLFGCGGLLGLRRSPGRDA